MTGTILDVEGVGKSFRTYAHESRRVLGWITGKPSGFVDNWILRDISFSMRPGEGMGILGRNGAGKSTLLKVIAGTTPPTEGRVVLKGRVNVLELGIGFNPEFTGRENVLHSLSMMGHDRAAILEHMPQIEAFAEVGNYFDQPLRVYSSGMYMRVAFAAATMFPPDVLIVDEALSVGDAFFQAKCFERINQLRDLGTGLLFVSHSAGEVAKHCEHAIFLDQGRLAMSGTAREVSNAYLDHLFGKGRPSQKRSNTPTADAPKFSDVTADVFATRPFYRKDEYRWGQGGARICDFSLSAEGVEFPPQVMTHQTLRVTYKVVFDRDVDRPLYGLLIKALDGMFLYGTNSSIAGALNEEPVKQGDVRIVTFNVPMSLNSGAYLLSVGVTDESDSGQHIPLDRRYDSILLPVENPRPGTGQLDLDAKVSISSPPAKVPAL